MPIADEIESPVGQAAQPVAFLHNRSQKGFLFGIIHDVPHVQAFGQHPHGRQGRAQIMRDRGREIRSLPGVQDFTRRLSPDQPGPRHHADDEQAPAPAIEPRLKPGVGEKCHRIRRSGFQSNGFQG